MKKLLLIMGDLAAGKTTFAYKLASRYGIVAFNKDGLKEVIANTYPYDSREKTRKISIVAVDTMIDAFRQFCLVGKPLILESNFHQDEIDRIDKIAKENNYEVLTLLVQADMEILHKRFVNRAENENRHPVHFSEMFKRFEDFKEYIENSRKEKPLGKVLKIDANSFNYQEDETILKQIDRFIND